MEPLTGTSNPAQMREDLACERFDLSPEELSLVESIAS